MPNLNNNGYLIIGAPTSGISALSGCLKILGVDLGSHIGLQEGWGDLINQEVSGIHEMLFNELGCSSNMIGDLPENWVESDSAIRARKFIKTALLNEFSNSGQWAIGDYRLCRLMPIWEEILQDLGVKPKIIFLSSDPRRMSSAFVNKMGISQRNALLIWLTHHKNGLEACRNKEHCILTFDGLMANPFDSLQKIEQSLNIKFPQPLRGRVNDILTFLHAKDSLKEQTPTTSEGETKRLAIYENLYHQLVLSITKIPNIESTLRTNLSNKDSNLIELEESNHSPILPILAIQGGSELNYENAKTISGLFNDLIQTISSFEEKEFKHQTQLQRYLLSKANTGESASCRLHILDEGAETNRQDYSPNQNKLLPTGEWIRLPFQINNLDNFRGKEVAIQISSQMAVLSIGSISIIDSISKEIVCLNNEKNNFQDFRICEGSIEIDRSEHLTVLAVGNAPILKFNLPSDFPDSPLEIIFWIKLEKTLSTIKATQLRDLSKIEELKISENQSKKELDSVRIEITKLLEFNKSLEAKFTDEEAKWEADRRLLLQEIENQSNRIAYLDKQLVDSRKKLEYIKTQIKVALGQTFER